MSDSTDTVHADDDADKAKPEKQESVRVPVRTYTVKDGRGRITRHWAALGKVEGNGATRREALDDLSARIVALVHGLENRTRLVTGPHFGAAIVIATPEGFRYQKLRVDAGDGPADERIGLCSMTSGEFDSPDEAESAARAHAHSNAHRDCMSCKEERAVDDCRSYTTRSGAGVLICEVCIAGHGDEGAKRRAADGMPYPERDIEAWIPWRSSTEAGA